MFKTLEINLSKKEYAKKFTVIVIADQQGKYFPGVLKSVYNQTFDNQKIEVIIVIKEGTNVNINIIEEYQYRYQKMTRVVNNKGKSFSDIINSVAANKIKTKGEYITFLRSTNTFRTDAFEHFNRMNGDILAMGVQHINAKAGKQTIFNELHMKKIRVYLRSAGLHRPESMTTRYSTEFGKFYHTRLFKKLDKMEIYEAGTSFALYAMMLSRANDVFYYPRVCGTWRDNKGNYRHSVFALEEQKDYLRAIEFITKHRSESKIVNKIAFLNLYELVKNHKGKVPHVAMDIDMEHVNLRNYSRAPKLFRILFRRVSQRRVRRMRLYLGTRIKVK